MDTLSASLPRSHLGAHQGISSKPQVLILALLFSSDWGQHPCPPHPSEEVLAQMDLGKKSVPGGGSERDEKRGEVLTSSKKLGAVS